LLRFIYNAENVVFLGLLVLASLTGSCYWYEATQAGLSVYFANAGILIERLKKANSEGLLEDKIRTLAKYKLLIIDEMGYCLLIARVPIAFSSLCLNDMRRLQPSLRRINHMVIGRDIP